MRLGVPTRILAQRGLRAYDTRRPFNAPHLSVSLAHLHGVFAYLQTAGIQFYRLASALAPYTNHPELPSFDHQLNSCSTELAGLGTIARETGLRLTFHAPLHVQLASDDPAVAARSCTELGQLAALLGAMQLDQDAVIVVHVGHASQPEAAIGRWVARWERLHEYIRQRVVLEHDDRGASLGLALRIHGATGVPLVFDHLHFCLNNPEGWSLAEGLAVALATWPHDRTPKAHFSSPRTELRAVERIDPHTSKRRWLLGPPRAGHHADFLNPWEFAHFVQLAATERDFDVMLEAKASDLALARLRADLVRYAPYAARMLGIEAAAWEQRETVEGRKL